MNKWLKRAGWLLIAPIGLIVVISILLYLPPVQRFAVRQASAYAGKATGLHIGIEQIRLRFPLNLSIGGVEIRNDSIPQDTLLSLRRLEVRIQALPLLKKEVLVEGIALEQARINTGNLIDGVEVKGQIGHFRLQADRIDLDKQRAVFNRATLSDAALTVLTGESQAPDTSASQPVNWAIVLENIELKQVALAYQSLTDSTRVAASIPQAGLRNGEIDLGKGIYRVGRFGVGGASVRYDADFEEPAPGIDPNHIALSDLEIDWRDLLYAGRNMDADLRKFSFRERSGLQVDTLDGTLHADRNQIHVPGLKIRTAHSKADLTATIPWKSLDKKPGKEMTASFSAEIGREDLLLASGALPESFRHAFPAQNVGVKADLKGNMERLALERFDVEWPGILQGHSYGNLEAVADEKARKGEIQLRLTTLDLDFLRLLLPAESRSRFRIPNDMRLAARASLARQTYEASLLFREAGGSLRLDARYRPDTEQYALAARIDSLEPIHFLPQDSLMWLSASLEAGGQGTDPFSEKTRMTLSGKIRDIRYGKSSVSDISLEGSLKDHLAKVDFLSHYPLAKLDMSLNATLKKDDIQAMLIADMQHVDLQKLHFTEDPLSMSFQLFAEASTDLKKKYNADFTLGNWEVTTPKQTVRPKSLVLKAHSDADTTAVAFHAGDLSLTLSGNADITSLSAQLARVADGANRQLRQDSVLRLDELRPLLPELKLALDARRDNPIYNFLHIYYVEFDQIGFEARTSPEEGIHLDGGIFRLARDTFEIDTVRLCVRQDSAGIRYQANVAKLPHRKQPPFSISLDGKLRTDYADALLRYADGRDSTGLLLGIRMDKLKQGVKLHLFPDEPILAFRRFRLNPDNYLIYRNEKDLEADLRLSGDNNAALSVRTGEPENGLRELQAELSQIDLRVFSQAFPTWPPVEGLLNADLQYLPSDSSFTVVSGISVDSLHYNRGRVGDLLMNFVYLPSGKNEHQVDMHLLRDQEEILSATAFYDGKTDVNGLDHLQGNLAVHRLPMPMLNPFIPDGMARLSGHLLGEMAISGSTQAPAIEGFLQLDTAQVYITAANTTLSLERKKITVHDNRIWFDRYSIYSTGKNPFVVDGHIDFENTGQPVADLRLTADNMQLLNAKRNKNSLVYGKVLVGLNSTVKGPLDALTMRGNLNLLGGTNVTYVLQDSPLTVQDRLSGLVTFTSFDEDTLHRRRIRPAELPLGGMDMLMTIHIDQAVRINADLTPDQSSHVNLEGGGDLSFQYTQMGDMILNGRYTLSGGTIKYSLPIIPLKEFNIHEGSYVQWAGNPMDPTLNLKATERIRTSVTLDNGSSRMVNFDVGIALTERLENLGLKFTLEAPEDPNVQEQLARLGEEERAKQAVSMLVTGMYLAGGSSNSSKGGMNMGSALNSFLQSEINNLIGSQNAIDINVGMESYDENGDGTNRTDYSFRFAKRFYNDRIRIILGGRISTGEDINKGQAQPFIDNVSIEYRLDPSGTRYVKLFHNKDYESLLEGELIETGAGVVLRKKMQHLRELFIFKRNKVKPVKEKEQENEE